MSTSTETKVDDDTMTHWPPRAHIVRKKDLPARAGSIALCGHKLMGMDLDGDVTKATCEECLEVMREELSR